MATQTKNYVDFSGLSQYDALIKEWANSANQKGYKTILKSTDGNYLYLYKKANAVLGTDIPDANVALGGGDAAAKLDALASIVGATWVPATTEEPIVPAHYEIDLDATFDQATVDVVDALNELKGQINVLNGSDSITGSVAKAIKDAIEGLDVAEFALATVTNNVVNIKGIKEVDGEIVIGDGAGINLEEVAYTGAAADVSVADVGGKLEATTVEGALAELADAAGDKAVYFTDNTSTTGTDYATIYKIYQGSTGSAASPVAEELVGTINIPKDQFVNDAELVDITYSEGHLYDGVTDVTELIKGAGGTATAADAGKYFKIVFELSGTATKDKSTIYISVKELSHVYTGGATAEVSVSIDPATDVITASIVDIDGTKITYIAADAGQGISRESVSAALTRIDGDDSTTGSISKKIKDAIEGLDTTNDVGVASYDSSTTNITISGSIAEVNGIIGAGSGDNIVIGPVDSSDIAGLFTASSLVP